MAALHVINHVQVAEPFEDDEGRGSACTGGRKGEGVVVKHPWGWPEGNMGGEVERVRPDMRHSAQKLEDILLKR